MVFVSRNVEETIKIAEDFSKALRSGTLIILIGELGTGKTVFVKGMAKGLGFNPDDITSPSFVIIQPYGCLIHVDLYRVESSEFIPQIEEYLESGCIVAVEWGEKIGKIEGFPCFKVEIKAEDENSRRIIIENVK